MSKPSFDINKLKNSVLWMKLYHSNDPAGLLNIEVWNTWINIVAQNQVLNKIPIKSLAKIFNRPWPDDKELVTFPQRTDPLQT